MSSSLSPNIEQLLHLKDTNVSSPSIIHRSQSPQSITASESYYSLSSGGSSRILAANDRSTHTIQRFQTPPSRYRTPLQSKDNLAAPTEPQAPLRGQGQRRQSLDEAQLDAASASTSQVRDGVVKRKPVPSTVMEGHESYISPTNARSSVALDMARGQNAPTPDVDDTPYIHFALDQLTRDEEVRGSRAYVGPQNNVPTPATNPKETPNASMTHPNVTRAERTSPPRDSNYMIPPGTIASSAAVLPAAAQAAKSSSDASPHIAPQIRQPPPRNPNRPFSSQNIHESPKEQDIFLPLAANSSRPLNFRPATLRPLALVAFMLLTLAYLALLLFAAIYSLLYTGLWTYGTIGDNRYFIFRYLPVLLGMILLLWLFQIQIAVARIAPFVAMASSKVGPRLAALNLPIYLSDFLLPKFRYFRAGLPTIGLFMFVAWLQIFSIPLLASTFNVYYVDENWRWTAVQGIAWAVIGLYVLLAIMTVLLAISLARFEETGLRWDPRSMADLVVMLERSNALDAESEIRNDPARLGFWRTSQRPNEVFHAFGYANLEPRQYGIDGGRIKEKSIARDSGDNVSEGNRWRQSQDPMLGEETGSRARPAIAFPWFLRITFTLLWVIIALVLVVAFLVVSYLPTTSIFNGFLPSLPVIVGTLGFGADNFIFSFIPAILAMLCFLFWTNLDFTYRRFSPVLSLLRTHGELAERSLLLSYSADFPIHVSLAAAANGHWKISWISFNSLIAAGITVLASGVFWAQFDVASQEVKIYAHTPAFYALSALISLYAVSYILILPFSHAERDLAVHARRNANKISTFADFIALVRNSKLLDDFAFHGPVSKVDLVTRLLSVQPGAKVESARISSHPEAGTSMLSLADSVRGFGNARQRAIGGTSISGIPKYGLARWIGRDGNDFLGIDRHR